MKLFIVPQQNSKDYEVVSIAPSTVIPYVLDRPQPIFKGTYEQCCDFIKRGGKENETN